MQSPHAVFAAGRRVRNAPGDSDGEMRAYTVFAAPTPAQPAFILCAARLSHPSDAGTDESKRVWKAHRVGTTLNMADDVETLGRHVDAYVDSDMLRGHIPLDDAPLESPDTLLPALLEAYRRHMAERGASRAFMVNCGAGWNRSSLAVALLLWHTTPPEARPWKNADALIVHLRKQQYVQRGLPASCTLFNEAFCAFLRARCV